MLHEAHGFTQGYDQYFNLYETVERIRAPKSAKGILNKADELIPELNAKAPFFLYVHFVEAHAPYICEEEDLRVLEGSRMFSVEKKLSIKDKRKRSEHLKHSFVWENNLDEDFLSSYKKCYAAGVRNFDRYIGKLLRLLKKNKLYKESVIIFTSDHGEEFLEHGSWERGGRLFNESLKVPLILKLPNNQKKGTRVKSPVGLIDLPPTILGLAGLKKYPDFYQGRNLIPFADKDNEPNRYVFASGVRGAPEMASIQNRFIKKIDNFHANFGFLFELEKDPTEKRNLNQIRNFRSDELKEMLWSKLNKDWALREKFGAEKNINEKLIEDLKALGYLN